MIRTRTRRALRAAAAAALLFPAMVLTLVMTAAPAHADTYHPKPCGYNGPDETTTRDQALTRARSWLAAGVPYSREHCFQNTYGDYRADCSGFVSMAWGIGGNGHDWWTGNLDQKTFYISAAQLQPGDALLRSVGDPDLDHVALFVRWSDAARTRPVVIEQTGGSIRRTIERTWSGYSGYQPVRYDHIAGGGGGGGRGVSTIGYWKSGGFHLRNSNSSGSSDATFTYGESGTGVVPLVGDWNGDGVDSIGYWKAGGFHLRNGNSSGSSDATFTYGESGTGVVPLVGDWNGDGVDSIGYWKAGGFHLRNSNSSGSSDATFTYGESVAGVVPLVGDWDGDGRDTVGYWKSGGFHLRNSNSSGSSDLAFTYGESGAGVVPLVGDWNGNGTDSIGYWKGGGFHLSYSNSSGPSDLAFTYGESVAGVVPLTGDWNGA